LKQKTLSRVHQRGSGPAERKKKKKKKTARGGKSPLSTKSGEKTHPRGLPGKEDASWGTTEYGEAQLRGTG